MITENIGEKSDLQHRETDNLIGSDKVEGTAVYRPDGIGNIKYVMIEKISGRVSYAVMTFGGFMGIGEDYYPLPWSWLTYNGSVGLGGYEVALTEEQIKYAPHYGKYQNWDWVRGEDAIRNYYSAMSL